MIKVNALIADRKIICTSITYFRFQEVVHRHRLKTFSCSAHVTILESQIRSFRFCFWQASDFKSSKIFNLEKCLKLLGDFELDEVDASIFRGQVCTLTETTSVVKIAKQHKLSRQSVNQRRLHIFENVRKLELTSEFKTLTKFFRRRGMQSNSVFEFSPEDNLVSIHSVQSSAEFPTVVDVVNAALWLIQQEVGRIALRSVKA